MAVVVVDSKRRGGVWRGGMGWGDGLRKGRWVGFDDDVDVESDAQHGVVSLGWSFKLVNAERRCVEWGGSILDTTRGKALRGGGLVWSVREGSAHDWSFR